jgi:hypothetical protein
MGTRADFYLGLDRSAVWLGSTAWDGFEHEAHLVHVRTEGAFRRYLAKIAARDDFTSPAKGWPWPWRDSRTTDVAYAFHDGGVWEYEKDYWYPVGRDIAALRLPAEFPDMTAKQRVAHGPRSGLVEVRPLRRRRVFELSLSAVADMVCRRTIIAEVAAKRAEKRKRRRGRR